MVEREAQAAAPAPDQASAPASAPSQTVNKEDCSDLLQAAGHVGSFYQDKSLPSNWVYKPYDKVEARNYETLWKDGEALQRCVAQWDGTVQVSVGSAENGESEQFMKMENLLDKFQDPCIMDCKMGCRTFQEKEGESKKPRADLYTKLCEQMPEVITEEEHKSGTITKFKWTTSRDAAMTSKLLAFRVDGIVSKQGDRIPKKDLTKISTREEVLNVLPRLLPLHSPTETDEETTCKRVMLVEQLLDQLEGVRESMEASSFFRSYEFVGASLLFVVDHKQAKVALIDFAKTEPLPEGCVISHRGEWQMGNHEDSLLRGVDNLIDCWRTTLVWLKGASTSGPSGNSQQTFDDLRMQEFQKKLSSHGVDTTGWGAGGAKTFLELYQEMHEERASQFEVVDDELVRVMDVIKAWVLVDLPDREVLVLIEPKKHDKFSKDTKKEVGGEVKGKPLQKKVQDGQFWKDTLYQGIAERLGIPLESQEGVLDIQWDTYKRNCESRLGTVKDGFLGLRSTYNVHEIDVRIKGLESPLLTRLGLPEASDFVTMNAAGAHSVFGHRQHFWTWQPLHKQAGYVARNGSAATAAT